MCLWPKPGSSRNARAGARVLGCVLSAAPGLRVPSRGLFHGRLRETGSRGTRQRGETGKARKEQRDRHTVKQTEVGLGTVSRAQKWGRRGKKSRDALQAGWLGPSAWRCRSGGPSLSPAASPEEVRGLGPRWAALGDWPRPPACLLLACQVSPRGRTACSRARPPVGLAGSRETGPAAASCSRRHPPRSGRYHHAWAEPEIL